MSFTSCLTWCSWSFQIRDSYWSTTTYSFGPCVGVKQDMPRLSASEVTCWQESELYWTAVGFLCMLWSSELLTFPYFLSCVCCNLVLIFLNVLWLCSFMPDGFFSKKKAQILSLKNDVCVYFQFSFSHIAFLWALSLYLHSHTHCLLQLVT